MNETRKRIYDEWREEFKNDPAKAVGWRNQEALDARFTCTLKHLHNSIKYSKILDVGCGTSLNLLRYIEDPLQYVGIDCNEGSLLDASTNWHIPYRPEMTDESKLLLLDEYLEKVKDHRFDIIVSQGIYQEFDNIVSIRKHVKALSELLNSHGELLIMTPANRVLDAEGKSVLKISAYDAVSILEYTELPYELFLGELGEHIIMRVYRKD